MADFRNRISATMCLSLLLTGCSSTDFYANSKSTIIQEASVVKTTRSTKLLRSIPAAAEKMTVSVYEFQDQTGQLKPNDRLTDYSRAVTQGGLALLNEALLNAGNMTWFDVVERGGLKNLLQERQIIRTMREQYAPGDPALGTLPPLIYAGMLIEGGIIGYDSDVVTGGYGARYLGVGGDVKYRRDIVTVTLRAVSISTGKVAMSVTTEKTLFSTAVSGNIFKFVGFDKLLEMETGFTQNEPPQLAVRQAIEMAVYSMVMEGARSNLWQFNDPVAGQKALNDYIRRVETPSTVPLDNATPVSQANAPFTAVKPTASELPQTPTAEAPKGSEKGSIFDNISDFLNFNDKPATPPPYPVITNNPR